MEGPGEEQRTGEAGKQVGVHCLLGTPLDREVTILQGGAVLMGKLQSSSGLSQCK